MRNKCNEQFEMVVSTGVVMVPSTGSGTGMQTSSGTGMQTGSGTEETVVELVETTEGTAIRQLYKP